MIRADTVGSLLRPPYLVKAREAFEAGRSSAAEFKRVEDRAVDEAIQLQEACGLDVITDAPAKSRTLLFRLVKEGGRWVEVVPCAKPETVVAIRAARAETARRAERAKALAASTWPALRERVLALYRSGSRIDAYKMYARESGEDLTIAREVVDLLAEGDR